MNIKIERADRGGNWHEEGQMSLPAYFTAHPTDEITQGMIRAALVATGTYEHGDRRLTLVRRAAA